MDSRNYNIILGKRYLIQKYDKSTILVEFTIEQDVFENEVCAGTNAILLMTKTNHLSAPYIITI